MSRSPHSLANVKAALKEARIEGRWRRFPSGSLRFRAESGAYFWFVEPHDIYFYGPSAAWKQLRRAIWSYTPPDPEVVESTRRLARILKRIHKKRL